VSLVAVESAVLLLQAMVLLPTLGGERLAMGTTSVLFFVLYGGGLAFCAWSLWRLASWARAPVVLAQLIQIMVGASFWGGTTTVVAVVAIVVAVLALAGIFHPQSLAALEPTE
jgi:L-alanine-DL-glutamate epimerase-like enolase superfamily enzyme